MNMQGYPNYLYQQSPYNPNVMNPVQYQQSQMFGRVVDDFNLVTASDVPMDGSPATFIKRDMSEIELRMWTPNGQIKCVKFAPKIEEPNNVSSEQLESQNEAITLATEGIMDRLDRIEKMLSQKTSTKTRKEVATDE